MSKAPRVLIPPFDTLNTFNNPVVMIHHICMFNYAGEASINFALLNGGLVTWQFESEFDCNEAMQGIYDQLGVIE